MRERQLDLEDMAPSLGLSAGDTSMLLGRRTPTDVGDRSQPQRDRWGDDRVLDDPRGSVPG